MYQKNLMLVLQFLNYEEYHPYNIQLHQELFEGNPDRRLQFCDFCRIYETAVNILLNKLCFLMMLHFAYITVIRIILTG